VDWNSGATRQSADEVDRKSKDTHAIVIRVRVVMRLRRGYFCQEEAMVLSFILPKILKSAVEAVRGSSS
jgi:hypothetical protein